MHKYFTLLTCVLCQFTLKGQDSLNVKFLQKKLLNSYPKKMYSIKEDIEAAKNRYVYNKSNDEVFMVHNNSNKHDSNYVFCYLNKKIAFAVLMVRPDITKKKVKGYEYYIENGIFVPIKKSPANNQLIYDAINNKATQCYQQAEAALLKRKQRLR